MSANTISQMQMRFVPEEDRILYRVNSADGQQFRFWLTRRYVQLMVQALHTHLDADPDVTAQATQDAKQAVQSFKQEKAIQGANFQQEFKEQAAELPLGETALLAYRLNYRFENEVLHLGIEPKQGQGINLAINREINMSMTRLLDSAVKQANWQLGPPKALAPSPKPIVN